MQHAFPSVSVFAVSRRAELSNLCRKQKFKSQFGIVIDFGVIIDQDVIDSFPYGVINSHFSLLPEWRGVDPITFAILSGQRETGVSLMRIVREWDEGPLLAQAPYAIPSTATTPELTHDLIQISDSMIGEVVPRYLRDEIEPQDQLTATIGPKKPSYSRKLTKEDGKIDWNKPAAVLEREIRAYIGWPRSYTTLGGIDVIIRKVNVVDQVGKPGSIDLQGKRLLVHCGEQSLEVLEIQPAGKKAMAASAFLDGYSQKLLA